VLTVFVLGALCDEDAAAVAEQGSNVSVKFYDRVFVIHKPTLFLETRYRSIFSDSVFQKQGKAEWAGSGNSPIFERR
jgi:hypothetical protein